jgi:hypothetical protein
MELNVENLRKLYRSGKGGVTNRRVVKLTLSLPTFEALIQIVPFGKGLYGSPFIELAIRMLIALIGDDKDNLLKVCQELQSICDTKDFSKNIKLLSGYFNK